MESLPPQKSVEESEAESGLYKTVEFRMYCFKVLPCGKRFCHDWTNCPFAHPGEKARRRDPRVYHYKGIACPEMKMGQPCPRGGACPFAHNVFEYWLHPNRYRTQPCNDGPACARKVCFFAHTLDELRVPSEDEHRDVEAMSDSVEEAEVEKLIRDSCDPPSPPHQELPSTTSASEQTYFMSSLASSFLTQLPDPEFQELEKSVHLEKAVSDLLDQELESPKMRSPLSSFHLQNFNTSALESGYHWNGGPPKLFVDRSMSNSFRRSLSTDLENVCSEWMSHHYALASALSPFDFKFSVD